MHGESGELHGERVCFTHHPSQRENAKRANLRSAEVRKARAKARDEAVEEARINARLGIEHWLAVRADERDEELATALVDAAVKNPDGRAMAMLLERRLGKVPDFLTLRQTQGTDDPFEMDMPELAKLDALPETSAPTPDD